MTNLAPAPEPEEDRYDGLPDGWPESAKETYAQVEEAHPDLDPAALSTLYEACHLIALADRMQAQVDADGLTVPGSRGQLSAHPLVDQVRYCRAAAMQGLRALGIAPAQSAQSAAGAALAGKRWHGRTPGRRRPA